MKKIMFNDKYGLTEAVLNGKKTQTRRLVASGKIYNTTTNEMYEGELSEPYQKRLVEKFSRYKVGEVVAVAQAYNSIWQHVGYMTAEEAKVTPGYRNKMFVKAELMPHHIKITNIRVEKLQDISEEDCLAEGIYEVKGGFDETNYAYKGIGNSMFGTARCAYMSLIDKVCECYVWNQNPYVFVYEFELVD